MKSNVDPGTLVDHVAGSLCGRRARVVAGHGATTVSTAERKGHLSLLATTRVVGGDVLDCQMAAACEPFLDFGGEDFHHWLDVEMGFRDLMDLCYLMDAEVHFVLTACHGLVRMLDDEGLTACYGLVRMMDGKGLTVSDAATPSPDVPGYLSVSRYREGLEQEASVRKAFQKTGTAAARVCQALSNLNPFHF